MSHYRLTYADLHDYSGNPLKDTFPDVSLKGYSDVLRYRVCFWLFILRVKLDAKRYNLPFDVVPLSFCVTRLRQMGYLDRKLPDGIFSRYLYAGSFLRKLIDL